MRTKPAALFLLLGCFCIPPALSAPLLIVGEGDAAMQAAIAYDLLANPLRRSFDHGTGRVTVNLPFQFTQPLHRALEENAGGFLTVPNFTARAQQAFNTSVEVSYPMFGGAGFFAVRENARLAVNGSIGNANIRIDTVKPRDEGAVLLRGGVNVPLVFDAWWRTITFGYALRPTPLIRIGFQVHRHSLGASTAGNLSTSLAGRIELASADNLVSLSATYPEDRVFGRVDGAYEGSAWTPEIGLQVGPVGLVSRMGFEVEARGHLYSEYSVPFFIDEKTFTPRYTAPDSFLTAGSINRLKNAEVTRGSYRIEDRLLARFPQSHTLYLDLVSNRLFLSYTKTFGRLETVSRACGASCDSAAVAMGDWLDASARTDHLVILSLDLGWFRHHLGAGTAAFSYRHRDNLLGGVFDRYGLDPLLPVWNFGLSAGRKVSFSLNFFVLPLPALRTGMEYAF